MFYVARWYDRSLARFSSADTLVPGAGNPMAWDRYAYTLNNPVRYSDPTGHVCYDAGVDAAFPGDCNGGSGTHPTPGEPGQCYGNCDQPPKTETSLPPDQNHNSCNPSTSNTCYGTEYGLCLPGIGCSGYPDGWYEWYMQQYFNRYAADDISAILGFWGDFKDIEDFWKGTNTPLWPIDFIAEFAEDANLNLTIGQRVGRAGIGLGEDALISAIAVEISTQVSLASITPSAGGAVATGQLWVVPVVVGGSFIATYVVVSYSLSNGADYVNDYIIYPNTGLSPNP